MGPIEDVDWSAWVRAMEINVYGSVLPCRAFVPHFKHHRYGKIVQLSGGGATNPLPRISAYAASKAAIVRFAESLALEVSPFGIDVNAIAPGALNTRMLDEAVAAGPEAVGADFTIAWSRPRARAARRSRRGAALAVYLGSATSDGITGRLLSAVWDPWENLRDATRRSRAQRRLHTPADRAERPRLDVGRHVNSPGVAIVGMRPDRAETRRSSRRSARSSVCVDTMPERAASWPAARAQERSTTGKRRSPPPMSTS